MDYFLCRPIYAYPNTINLMYYNTIVLIMKNYFSHQISYLVHSSICKTDWCSGVPEIYGGLGVGVAGMSTMGVCAFFPM